MAEKIPQLELLAPARDAETAMAAIAHGADAVYIGGPAFGARAAAGNSIADIARVVEEAHKFGVRVYVTLNTIIYEHELDEVKRTVENLYAAGVDALIVQDMALLELDLPPIDLHASTQTDARSPEKVAMLSAAGFSQIVLPREFSLEEIRKAAQAAPASDIEVFVHGALCVSYSGDCHAGAILAGRSANRGECPQICRLKYQLTGPDGKPVARLKDNGPAVRHWLSLVDLNQSANLLPLADAGARSFKIEGRLKPVVYVKNITATYSDALDKAIAASGGRYRRASFGKVEKTFTALPSKSFNRGFSTAFLYGRPKGMISEYTPKFAGEPVGTVAAVKNGALLLNTTAQLHNGDGLTFFNRDHELIGFRVNRAEGDRIFPAPGTKNLPEPGTTLFRNFDSEFETILGRPDSARRTIGLNITIRHLPDGRVALDVRDERGNAITVTTSQPFSDTARSPQEAMRADLLSRLGDTIYRLDSLDDRLGNLFMPSKALVALRRLALDALDRAWRMRYTRRTRRKSSLGAESMKGLITTYHDNVANSLAEKFYIRHGATVDEKAAEVETPRGEVRVMTTRYCLRNQIGACLMRDDCGDIPRQLYLEAPIGRLRLDFDCKNCQMKIYVKK